VDAWDAQVRLAASAPIHSCGSDTSIPRGWQGRTALHCVASSLAGPVVDALLELGADVSISKVNNTLTSDV
jgi:ankyrin repeat protein